MAYRPYIIIELVEVPTDAYVCSTVWPMGPISLLNLVEVPTNAYVEGRSQRGGGAAPSQNPVCRQINVYTMCLDFQFYYLMLI